jgi:undecaprenyl-diphosphatase
MPLYQAIVLAIVQGVAEFLPISSTGHLILFPWLLGWKDPGLTFDVALHAGTLVAVLIYFWRIWVEMLAAAAGLGRGDPVVVRQKRRLFWYLIVATIPGGIIGLLFEKAADEQLRQPVIIGFALVIVALLMWAGEVRGRRQEKLEDVSLGSALFVGVAQSLAVIPGVSRSGITMTAGLFSGMDRETDARFSFLLSTPIIAGAALKKGLEVHKHGLPPGMHLPFIVGILVSAAVGYAVITWLLRFLSTRTFKPFIIYRLALGVLVLALGWGLRH